uniref:AAA domain protein n=1 Tax=Megaviridae environmental sample TaxID=1737588 RepID=A0A5J6VJI1_9VIRU|nr:MAG: AAA domain protein [Megaviridae environmental sample]
MELDDMYLGHLISGYKSLKEPSDNKVMPSKFPNISTAIDEFRKQLEVEFYYSASEPKSKPQDPIAKLVNVDVKPGIIKSYDKDASMCKVYYGGKSNIKKKRKINRKTPDEELIKYNERRKLELERVEKEKQRQDVLQQERTTMKNHRDSIKQVKEMKKQKAPQEEIDAAVFNQQELVEKVNKIKAERKAKAASRKPRKKKEPKDPSNDQVDPSNDQVDPSNDQVDPSNDQVDPSNDQVDPSNDQVDPSNDQVDPSNDPPLDPKTELLLEKLVETNIAYEEPLDIQDEPLDIQDEPLDIQDEHIDELVFYESPIPHMRHIDALDNCNPNPLLHNMLLMGKPTPGILPKDDFCQIIHGPPGTGKTTKLIHMIRDELMETHNNRILVCACTNVAVINAYNRAVSLGVPGKLVLGNKNNLPKNTHIAKEIMHRDKHRVIFSTISMRNSRTIRSKNFESIYVDEASQVLEAWIWGLLNYTTTKLVLAGDPKQLPANTTQEGAMRNYNISMMERLIGLGAPTQFLNTQRRMHPNIVKNPNKWWYDGRLKTQYSGSPLDMEAFHIVNVKGTPKREQTSWKNPQEALAIVQELKKLNGVNCVVLAPYVAQQRYLEELLNKEKLDTPVHTVDSFQGQEADVVFITVVRHKEMGFWQDERRMNVALTRAKHALWLFGSKDEWGHPFNQFL